MKVIMSAFISSSVHYTKSYSQYYSMLFTVTTTGLISRNVNLVRKMYQYIDILIH